MLYTGWDSCVGMRVSEELEREHMGSLKFNERNCSCVQGVFAVTYLVQGYNSKCSDERLIHKTSVL